MNRREPGCLSEGKGLTAGGMGRRRPAGWVAAEPEGAGGSQEAAGDAVEEVLRSKTSRERWMTLMKLVREGFPHCIMYGVHIADGVIISCETMQRSLLFGPSPATRDGVEPTFDANWQELEALCKRLGTGQLAEVQFTDGQPIRAKTTPRGRRFRYFIND